MSPADGLALYQGVAKVDEQLLAHEEHLRYRFAQYQRTKAAIEQKEGSLQNFAKVLALPCACSSLHLGLYVRLIAVELHA